MLEFVPGETLAERIKRGPIPLHETLSLFKQIAEALEAAHESGVIHRDLKPANIKVTPEGRAKVLDFGLAKAMTGRAVVQDLSESPTLTREGTETGVLLGTAPYMSPKQARGKTVDKRADIWAFGCCLYESLTGKTAFLGETVSDTIAAILDREPDWQALPEKTPALIRSLLRRCVQKDPPQRLHDIADSRIEIEEALGEPFHVAPEDTSPVLQLPLWRRALPWGLTTIMTVVSCLALWMARGEKTPVPAMPERYAIHLPDDASLSSMFTTAIALSPDGSKLVYAASTEDGRRLFLRDINRFETQSISGTEGATGPFFSPDGQWIGFLDFPRRLFKKVSLHGGAPIVICDGIGSRGASWGRDDRIVFNRAYNSGLSIVSANGGEPEVLTTPDPQKSEKSHRFPHILPDGKSVLFTIGTSKISIWDEATIAVVSMETGEQKVLLEGGSCAQYIPSGHILYGREDSLMAVPFDLERLEITDAPFRVVEGVVTSPVWGQGHFTVSAKGSLFYVPSVHDTGEGPSRLLRVNRRGDAQPFPLAPVHATSARLSPDGSFLVFTMRNRQTGLDIWFLHMKGDPTPQPFLVTEFDEGAPDLSPDGRWIAYCSDETGRFEVYVQPVSGRGRRWQISTDGGLGPIWSPSGKEIYYRKGDEMMNVTIETEPVLSLSRPETLFETDYFLQAFGPYRSYDVEPTERICTLC